MSLKDIICRHDAPMQPWQVTPGAALVRHTDPSGVSQSCRVAMFECSTGELVARAVFMHHVDQGYDASRHDALPKDLRGSQQKH